MNPFSWLLEGGAEAGRPTAPRPGTSLEKQASPATCLPVTSSLAAASAQGSLWELRGAGDLNRNSRSMIARLQVP